MCICLCVYACMNVYIPIHICLCDSFLGACDNPTWKQILFTAPYNRSVDLRGRQRLDNWTDGRWRDIIEDFKKRI